MILLLQKRITKVWPSIPLIKILKVKVTPEFAEATSHFEFRVGIVTENGSSYLYSEG